MGRVISTGTNWAKVLLLIDPSSSVNAAVQSTRATGVVQGNIAGQFIIKYVPQGEAIKTGDLIISSGMGGDISQTACHRHGDRSPQARYRAVSRSNHQARRRFHALGIRFDSQKVHTVGHYARADACANTQTDTDPHAHPGSLTMPIWVLVPALVLAAIAQIAWLPALSVWGFKIDLALVLVVVWGLLGPIGQAAQWGFILGLVLDLASGLPFGIHTLTLTLIGLGVGWSQTTFFRGNLDRPAAGDPACNHSGSHLDSRVTGSIRSPSRLDRLSDAHHFTLRDSQHARCAARLFPLAMVPTPALSADGILIVPIDAQIVWT